MNNEITTKNKFLKYSILLFIAIVIVGIFWVTNLTGNSVKDISCEGDSCSVGNVKEFVMTSFTEVIDGKYYPQYSLKNITVNKGDLVRIKITVTSGMHDFKIDEFDVYSDTPLDEEIIIEFVADEAGEFIYYCTKPGHRANGHWGTLIVKE